MSKCCKCKRPLLISKRKLKDGSRICNTCISDIPIDLVDYCLEKYSESDVLKLEEYKTISTERFDGIFRPTHSCGYIRLDKEHSLFKLNASNIIYEVKNLKRCEFAFVESGDIEDSFDFTLTIVSESPKFFLELVLSKGIPIMDIKPTSVGNDFREYLSNKTIEFMDALYKCFTDAKLEEFDKTAGEYKGIIKVTPDTFNDEVTNEAKNILDAIKLFKYDSLEGVSRRNLKLRRQELLSPNKVMSIDYINKINESYEILEQFIKQMEG